jgi:hypothetical protein
MKRPDCDGFDSPPGDWFQKLAYTVLARSASAKTIMAEDTCNCGSPGGTSGARPMWLVLLRKGRATLLAKSGGDFQGWLFRVVPGRSALYPDLILGWHMSAFESDLTWLRFNGRGYHTISKAKWLRPKDGSGNGRIQLN